MEVNYKNKKKYKTAKYPIRQPKIIVYIIWLLSKIMLIGKKYKIEKINMEGLKPPYIALSNHMYFIDFELAALGTFPHRVNNVVTIDGFYRRPWIMELIGAICTRKFTMDLHLVKSIRKVIKRGDVLMMYPEARYSPAGTTSYIPPSVGKLIKMNKVPVVAIVHHGNYLHTPFWNYRNPRKCPLKTTFKQILTAEQVEKMTADEIYEAVKEALYYNEYEYQKENKILITEPNRAEGLHKILYQCPNCKTEFKMNSHLDEIYCEECNKRWKLQENGELKSFTGNTEFSTVPEWFDWEREQVVEQINNGEYAFSDEVEVYSLPRCWKFEKLGKATLTHDTENGFTIKGFYRGKPYEVNRPPIKSNSLHVEYDYCYIKPEDCIDISTEDDSFYCYPKSKNVITKLGFATEELYNIKQKETKRQPLKK